MRSLLLALLVTLAASTAWAVVNIVPGTPCTPSDTRTCAGPQQITSGINGENLDDDPVTDTIPHKAGDTVFLTGIVTIGTTTTVDVACEDSATGAANTWGWIHKTDNADPAAAVIDTVRYTLSETTLLSVKVYNAQAYVRCTFFGSAAGTGTIKVYGSLP